MSERRNPLQERLKKHFSLILKELPERWFWNPFFGTSKSPVTYKGERRPVLVMHYR
jgi:hypothetical protein